MPTVDSSADSRSGGSAANGPVASVVWGIVGVLVGAVIGLFGTLYTVHAQSSQQDKDRAVAADREQRSERRPIYKALRDAANVYATAEAEAFQCQKSAAECSRLANNVQSARYDFQRAINDMTVFGSPKAIAAMKQLARSLPPSLPASSNSEPTVGPVDEAAFGASLVEFDAQTRADVAAVDTPR